MTGHGCEGQICSRAPCLPLCPDNQLQAAAAAAAVLAEFTASLSLPSHFYFFLSFVTPPLIHMH